MSSKGETAIFYHPAFLKHDPGPAHPEQPARISRTLQLLEKRKVLEKIDVLEPQPASAEDILRVHSKDLWETVKRFCEQGGGYLDADTAVSADSLEAAVLAAGAVIGAVDKVLQENGHAFCLVRPPGHHATSNHSMGFCLFNNVAVGAMYGLEKQGLSRMAIVDFDAHHGNGLQEIFYASSQVLYISLHQEFLYPGTGHLEEIGAEAGRGYTVNVPLPPGSGDSIYKAVTGEIITSLLYNYQPELILVSAGYDGHRDDPLASLSLTTTGYQYLARRLKELAEEICEGRLVMSLEGGYNLEALAESVLVTISELAGMEAQLGGPACHRLKAKPMADRQAMAGRLDEGREDAVNIETVLVGPREQLRKNWLVATPK